MLRLVYFAAIICAVSAKQRPLRSIKEPAETVNEYSVVNPQIISIRQGDVPHPKYLEVFIATGTLNATLVLEMNDQLIPPEFSSVSYGKNGEETISQGHINCYYQGKVKENPDWTAIITTCHGLQGSFGVHDFTHPDHQDLYHIEPLKRDDMTLTQPHAVYLNSEYKTRQGTCGSSHHKHHSHINTTFASLNLNLLVKRQTQQFRFVELLMVNDNRQYVNMGRNLTATVNRDLVIANAMDTYYRVLNVRIALVSTITWTDRDLITTTNNDASALLDNFRNYRPQVTMNHDALMLLTGIDLRGSTIGIAFTSTMCSSTSSVGISQDTGAGTPSTAAHELGHIMNMDHDDATTCNCPDGNSRCIMAASLSSNPPTRWSQCSQNELQSGFTNRNLDRCLFNEPPTVVGDIVCGNGILQAGEACDCGSPAECQNPCCNAATCQLATGASCFTGSCCDLATCSYKRYSTTCRASNGECDITEFCQGDSPDCPSDTYKRDGTGCNGNADNCYEGMCATYTSQCQRLFAAPVGADICFTFNNRGDQFGNCGVSGNTFVACTQSNARCGLLHCNGGTYQQIGGGGSTGTLTIGSSICRSFTPSNAGDSVTHVGLVADGSRCASGMACFRQQCTAITNLPSVSNLPSCSNQQTCSNNGQCNHLGQCTCNVGFTGSDCGTTTSGPGVGPVNECLTNNGNCGQICTDTVNSHTCSCNTGFTLQSNGRSCSDINECTANTDGCAQVCTNNAGSFTCSCNSGYVIAPDGRGCNDLNECSTSNGGCQQICTNQVGSFTCSCNTGFRLDSNGRSCADIDECSIKNGGCSQNCKNEVGSFTCACFTGFRLEADGKSCTALNACGDNNCEQFCSNQGGSPVCSCSPGFNLGQDEKSCNDINECAESNGGCSNTCTNTDGSFECSCQPGFQLDGANRLCSDIDECAFNRDGCSNDCNNTVGSYTCLCPLGYELDSDQRKCLIITNSTGSSSGSAVNSAAIAGGAVAAILAGVIVIVIIGVVLFCVCKNRKSKHGVVKYSRGRTYPPATNAFLASNSQQNLLNVNVDTASVQYRGYNNYAPPPPAYTAPGTQPSAPLYPPFPLNPAPAAAPQAAQQSRRPPPAPAPKNPGQARQTAPFRPPPAQPNPKPSAPPRPAAPQSILPKPATKPQVPPPYVSPTPKPPAPARKPFILPPTSPPTQKPAPAPRPPVTTKPVTTKPVPAPKLAPSKVNVWPPLPPSPNAPNSSAGPSNGRQPMLPPAKRPMVPPKN